MRSVSRCRRWPASRPRSSSVAFFSTVTGELDGHRRHWTPSTGTAASGSRCSSTRRCAAPRDAGSPGVHRIQPASGVDRRHRRDLGRSRSRRRPSSSRRWAAMTAGCNGFGCRRARRTSPVWGWTGGAAVAGRAPRVDLPTYAFQRRRFWLAPDSARARRMLRRLGIGRGRAWLVGGGGPAAGFGWGGVDWSAFVASAAVAGRSRGGRRGVVPGRGICGVGHPRR